MKFEDYQKKAVIHFEWLHEFNEANEREDYLYLKLLSKIGDCCGIWLLMEQEERKHDNNHYFKGLAKALLNTIGEVTYYVAVFYNFIGDDYDSTYDNTAFLMDGTLSNLLRQLAEIVTFNNKDDVYRVDMLNAAMRHIVTIINRMGYSLSIVLENNLKRF